MAEEHIRQQGRRRGKEATSDSDAPPSAPAAAPATGGSSSAAAVSVRPTILPRHGRRPRNGAAAGAAAFAAANARSSLRRHPAAVPPGDRCSCCRAVFLPLSSDPSRHRPPPGRGCAAPFGCRRPNLGLGPDEERRTVVAAAGFRRRRCWRRRRRRGADPTPGGRVGCDKRGRPLDKSGPRSRRKAYGGGGGVPDAPPVLGVRTLDPARRLGPPGQRGLPYELGARRPGPRPGPDGGFRRPPGQLPQVEADGRRAVQVPKGLRDRDGAGVDPRRRDAPVLGLGRDTGTRPGGGAVQ